MPITPATTRITNPFEKLTETTPLALLYNRILTKVGTYQPLLSISEELSSRFDFFAGVIWPEISTRISEELGHIIFSAGKPDELHKVGKRAGLSDYSTTPLPTTSSLTWRISLLRLKLSRSYENHRRIKRSKGDGSYQSISNFAGRKSSRLLKQVSADPHLPPANGL